MSEKMKSFRRLYHAWRVDDLSKSSVTHKRYMRDGYLPDQTGAINTLFTVLEKMGKGGTFDEIVERYIGPESHEQEVSFLSSRKAPVMKEWVGWSLVRLCQMGLVRRTDEGGFVPTFQAES